jgi:hypothetical protein
MYRFSSILVDLPDFRQGRVSFVEAEVSRAILSTNDTSIDSE